MKLLPFISDKRKEFKKDPFRPFPMNGQETIQRSWKNVLNYCDFEFVSNAISHFYLKVQNTKDYKRRKAFPFKVKLYPASIGKHSRNCAVGCIMNNRMLE